VNLRAREEYSLRMFGVLSRVLKPKRGEMAGGWRKLHNEEFYNFCSSSYIIRLIKLRRRWLGHVACMGRW
jgi:hypothetical protein